ncbi:MAG TPA: ATP-binding protein [Candidatus Limnocylindrales bacterium]|nr:ATP-binding protein [Candidatus Limnocylindrales bacterium]
MKPRRRFESRYADLAYALDRALTDSPTAHDFGRAAIDVLRLALRPSYAGLVYRMESGDFRCGDLAVSTDLHALQQALSRAPLSFIARPRALVRSDVGGAGLADVALAMTAAAFEVCFPLTLGAEVRGVLALGPRQDRSPYAEEDLELCSRIGARIAAVAGQQSLQSEVEKLRSLATRQERLAAVGEMAAGLAHEIRNPLVSIRTFTQLLPERYGDEEFRSGFLDLTLAEIDRITALVGELLSFARPAAGGDAAEAVDIAECLERTCALLRNQARSAGVALDLELEVGLGAAAIEEDRLRQIVLNLIVNAIQACNGRGRVVVSAGRSDRAPHLTCIRVRDDGPGMAAEVAARVFEPFFTTRSEGTGLGLALVKRIVEDHGGRIGVSTTPGAGACFSVELPIAAAVDTVIGGVGIHG